jgi:hypothetical protein
MTTHLPIEQDLAGRGMEEERNQESAAVVVVRMCVSGSFKAEEWGDGGGLVRYEDMVAAVRVG